MEIEFKIFRKVYSICLLSKTKMIDIFSRRKDYYGLPGGMVVKNPPANAGNARDKSSVLGSGRSPEVGNGNHSNILAWEIPWLGDV